MDRENLNTSLTLFELAEVAKIEKQRELKSQGKELVREYNAMLEKYNGLYTVAQGKRRREETASIVVAADKTLPQLGLTGTVYAELAPLYPPRFRDMQQTYGYHTTVFFNAPGLENDWSLADERLIDREPDSKRSAIGRGTKGADKIWTEEKISEAQKYTANLPQVEETFDLLLNAACDPTLNPEMAERAQAYRQKLDAIAIGAGPSEG